MKGDINALSFSLEEIIKRHEVLRSRFVMLDGEPRCEIRNTQSLDLPIIDISTIAPSEMADKIEELFEQEARIPFACAIIVFRVSKSGTASSALSRIKFTL